MAPRRDRGRSGARGADFVRGRGARGAGQRPPAPLPTLGGTGGLGYAGRCPRHPSRSPSGRASVRGAVGPGSGRAGQFRVTVQDHGRSTSGSRRPIPRRHAEAGALPGPLILMGSVSLPVIPGPALGRTHDFQVDSDCRSRCSDPGDLQAFRLDFKLAHATGPYYGR